MSADVRERSGTKKTTATTPTTSQATPDARPAPAAVNAVGTRVHLPVLDGIRGLAVMLVLVFHFITVEGGSPLIRVIQKVAGFGWVGVDLFFVLSGFLITGILLDAKRNTTAARSYFTSFYARRTVRIFPLYYAFLILFLLVLPAIVPNFHALFGYPPCGQWAYWTYAYNLFQGHHQGWDVFSHTLGITWSLCIEEQFYLVWPAVVWFCRPRTLLRICAGLVAMSLIARGVVGMVSGYEVFITQWTFCRMDPLAVGAALAIWFRSDSPATTTRLRRLAPIALWTIPVAVVAINAFGGKLKANLTFQTIGFTLITLLFGATILIGVTSPATSLMSRAFSNPLMRLFGRVSYAMYLFNQPINIVLRKYVFDPNTQLTLGGTQLPAYLTFFVLATAVTLAVSWLSWHSFEKHFLKLKDWFPMAGTTNVTMPPAKQNLPPSPMAPIRSANLPSV